MQSRTSLQPAWSASWAMAEAFLRDSAHAHQGAAFWNSKTTAGARDRRLGRAASKPRGHFTHGVYAGACQGHGQAAAASVTHLSSALAALARADASADLRRRLASRLSPPFWPFLGMVRLPRLSLAETLNLQQRLTLLSRADKVQLICSEGRRAC